MLVCGAQLRKEDALSLREVINEIRKRADQNNSQTTATTSGSNYKNVDLNEEKNENQSRVKFMLEMIMDLKNNKLLVADHGIKLIT
jgi:hypothetical protein